jgi:hypothetical protein
MPVSIENMKAEHWRAIHNVADEAAAARWADDGKPQSSSGVRQQIQKLRPTKAELGPLAEVIDRFDLDRRVAVRRFVSRFRTSYACKLLALD